MNGKRPTVLTVFGVLNIIFGSLGLLCNLCAVGGILLFAAILNAPPQGNADMAELQKVVQQMIEQVPGFLTYLFVSLAAGILLSAVLLFAGIGLLKVRPWGRTASIFYAVCIILVQVGGLVYSLSIADEMDRFQKQLEARGGQAQQPNPFGNAVGSVAGVGVNITYAVLLLIFMFTPTVTEAMKPRSERGYDDYDRDDQETDDYERRRRDEPT